MSPGPCVPVDGMCVGTGERPTDEAVSKWGVLDVKESFLSIIFNVASCCANAHTLNVDERAVATRLDTSHGCREDALAL